MSGLPTQFPDSDLFYQSSVLKHETPVPRFEKLAGKFVEPQFDPAIHLDLGEPQEITLLDFSTVDKMKPVQGTNESPCAYTSAFKVLSAEGVRVLKQIVAERQDQARSSSRTPMFMRALSYTSKFIRDFNESPEVLALLSKFAGIPLVPHYLPSNYSHVNIGVLPDPNSPVRPIDQWHADSVPFVLVIIISDMTDAVGGELQCIKRIGKDAAFDLVRETRNQIEDKDLLNVSYLAQGNGIFMQGSQIVHHVLPVLQAKEPRISVVNSFMPANCFAKDRTVYETFIGGAMSGDPEACFEFARGRAWRSAQQLNYMVDKMPFTNDPATLADHLRKVQFELQQTIDLLERRVVDKANYFLDEMSLNEAASKEKAAAAADAGVNISRGPNHME